MPTTPIDISPTHPHVVLTRFRCLYFDDRRTRLRRIRAARVRRALARDQRSEYDDHRKRVFGSKDVRFRSRDLLITTFVFGTLLGLGLNAWVAWEIEQSFGLSTTWSQIVKIIGNILVMGSLTGVGSLVFHGPRLQHARIAAALAVRRCPACTHNLEGVLSDPDGCTVCPECGAAWKLTAPTQPPTTPPPPPT